MLFHLQDKNGRTVAMYLARYGKPDVQRLWLKKWSPADCCTQLQDKIGFTVATYLAMHATSDVQRLWQEKLAAIN